MKKKPTFLRRSHDRYSKLGKRRKKIQKWRKPTGRHNKMREKRRGYPAVVSIGHKKSKTEKQITVRNLKDLENIKENHKIILGNIGKKKQIEIAKMAMEKKIKFVNLNLKKFLEKIEKKDKEPEKKISVEKAREIIQQKKEENKILEEEGK